MCLNHSHSLNNELNLKEYNNTMRSSRHKGRFSIVTASLIIALNLLSVFGLPAFTPAATAQAATANSDFQHDTGAEALFVDVWDKADGPVAAGRAARSWLWGPNTFLLARENYKESPGGERYIAYFDKARMELTHPSNDFVTNGLLVVEMMSGKYQDGDSYYVASPDGPATINVVGDTGNWLTYARFAAYASLNNDKRATNQVGQTIDKALSEAGGVVGAGSRVGQQKIAFFEPTLGHNVPSVFWDYLNQTGVVYSHAIQNFTDGQPINWLADAGFPITEAYWVKQKVNGQLKDVLVQAFQRRTLTFTPDNPVAYQVEMGNVGRHYVKWGYHLDLPVPQTLPAPVVVAPAAPPPPPPPPPASGPNPPPGGGGGGGGSGERVGAVCNDGTTTTATGRGACSHHGGVNHWLYK